MKKTILFLILIICSVGAYTQEAVGKINVKEPDIKIEMVFYDDNVTVETVLEIIKTRLLTAKSNRLKSVDYEVSDFLLEELYKRLEAIDFSKVNLEWGYITDYSTINYNFKYQNNDYFIIAVMPEDRSWFFEDLD